MLYVRVPATTANLGSGFDSIGMAFELYNHLWIEECDSGLCIEVEQTGTTQYDVERDERNMIYSSLVRFYQEVGKPIPKGIRMKQKDYIPMTRGLGSSAACIVSGLLAGNLLSQSNLSKDELCQLAAYIEGHPDNSTPAIMGGITIGALSGKRLDYVKLKSPKLSMLNFAVMIPEFQLSTDKARDVLPSSYSREDAVFNISRAALMIAAFESGDFSRLWTAMSDRIHQPYRMPLIPDMDRILDTCQHLGALAAFLSGAGPTLISIVEDRIAFKKDMRAFLGTLNNHWTLQFLEPDTEGAFVHKV